MTRINPHHLWPFPMIEIDFQLLQAVVEAGAKSPNAPSARLINSFLANEIETRMKKGRHVKYGVNWKGYSNFKPKRGFLTSPFYESRLSSKKWSGKGHRPNMWASNAAFHSATTKGSFNVSGGMWSGMSITGSARTSHIAFRGKSKGYSIKWKGEKGKQIRRKVNGKQVVIGRKKGRKVISKAMVNNTLKAYSIFSSTGVRVLDHSWGEDNALGEYWQLWLVKYLDHMFNGLPEWESPGKNTPKNPITRRMIRDLKHGKKQ